MRDSPLTTLASGPQRRSVRLAAKCAVQVPEKFSKDDWRRKARPIQPGSSYPAKENCSNCGLCDTYYVAHVKDACAFLGDGGFTARIVFRLEQSNPCS